MTKIFVLVWSWLNASSTNSFAPSFFSSSKEYLVFPSLLANFQCNKDNESVCWDGSRQKNEKERQSIFYILSEKKEKKVVVIFTWFSFLFFPSFVTTPNFILCGGLFGERAVVSVRLIVCVCVRPGKRTNKRTKKCSRRLQSFSHFSLGCLFSFFLTTRIIRDFHVITRKSSFNRVTSRFFLFESKQGGRFLT